MKKVLVTFAILLITSVITTAHGCTTSKYAEIIWENEYQKGDITYIPGTIKLDEGNYSFAWKMERHYYHLIYFDNSSGGEKKGSEEKLYLAFENKQSVAIFQEILPLINSGELIKLKKVASVKVQDLFESTKKSFRKFELLKMSSLNTITWGASYRQNESVYIPGSIKTSCGILPVSIKIGTGNFPQLVTLNSSGSGEVKPIEEKLLILDYLVKGNLMILKERLPLLNSEEPPMLQILATVRRVDFNEWKKQISK